MKKKTKEKIKNGKLTKPVYEQYSRIKKKRIYASKFSYHGSFVNRSGDKDKMCVILAGYKPFLYDIVFERIKRALTDDIDVCVVTSGLYSDEIAALCEKENWSYLSTKENNVSLVQNVAIKLHPKAKYIFKLDEDIFLTENFFENMLRAYNHAKESVYNPGVMAPILPINGYGYTRVLEKLGLDKEYVKRFGTVKAAATYKKGELVPIEGSGDVAKFFWGNDDIVPSIDEMNRIFSKQPLEERPCPVRFSIGAILFERSFWEDMDYYTVDPNANMGRDEVQICSHCCLKSQPVMVSENIVAGHFSFGKQTEAVKEFFFNNPQKFKLSN